MKLQLAVLGLFFLAGGQQSSKSAPGVRLDNWPTCAYGEFEGHHDEAAMQKWFAENCAPKLDYPNTLNVLLIYQGGVTVEGPGKSAIERLTPYEYARLLKVRQAVVDEEKRIAGAHGVVMDACVTCLVYPPQVNDSYEFRGQFLLINVPDGGR